MSRAMYVLAVVGALAVAGAVSGPAAQEAPPETVSFAGGPLGPVTFAHATHQTLTDCASCHHESREQNPLTTRFQACRGCHTSAPEAPMVTSNRAAFHDPGAQAGTCVTCHKAEAEAGKEAPTTCVGCHKR